ncbi:MvdC/MvdD family ATP grasp protein [Polyangium spumosum]|uniref:MvdC family ATP-grasp ribosomal peptide maturase n=1 Tax=Polyangium spumosum TaxID=889282 RepID=A0A6N7PI50_9BACT|nr:MvdC family ATP-grasp ribosomal peptide maturase [Polyangium spumosum]MRG91487.1 MvdC family ATP-grasp ribosomal peptide maturase [Polyangium spumosum]
MILYPDEVTVLVSKTVLLLSHAKEPFVTERVAEELRLRGARPLRLDTDRLFEDGTFGLSLAADEPGAVWARGEHLRPDSIWLWRAWPRIQAKAMAEADLAAVNREAFTLFWGALSLLEGRFVDPPDHVRAAENKPLQLRLARACGLRIPDTRYTSDPDAVRALFEAHDGRVVCKLHSPLEYGMRSARAFPTRRLRRDDLARLDALRRGPMIFQEEIPKALELRVAWAGGAAWTGALDGKQCGADWRFSGAGAWTPHVLDASIKKKLAALMRRLGLSQGCLDLIVTPSGETVFLEVNPTGEWGMLEAELGLPIAASIAETLLRENDEP